MHHGILVLKWHNNCQLEIHSAPVAKNRLSKFVDSQTLAFCVLKSLRVITSAQRQKESSRKQGHNMDTPDNVRTRQVRPVLHDTKQSQTYLAQTNVQCLYKLLSVVHTPQKYGLILKVYEETLNDLNAPHLSEVSVGKQCLVFLRMNQTRALCFYHKSYSTLCQYNTLLL